VSILLAGTDATDQQLADVLDDHEKGIDGMLQLLGDPDTNVRPPLGLLTASDLGRDLLELLKLARVSGSDRALRVATVNLSYDGMLAMIDLLKSHSDLPKVPRGSG
jgi:hypothetical protein